MTRTCGDCSLCCKLMPLPPLGKPANERCRHQHFQKGCACYGDIYVRPRACFVWSCRWLQGAEGTENLPRPDRAGYVIDEAPDVLTLQNNETGKLVDYPAIQIWVGDKANTIPKSLKRYMTEMGAKGFAIICRYDERHAMASLIHQGQWAHVGIEAAIGESKERTKKAYQLANMANS